MLDSNAEWEGQWSTKNSWSVLIHLYSEFQNCLNRLWTSKFVERNVCTYVLVRKSRTFRFDFKVIPLKLEKPQSRGRHVGSVKWNGVLSCPIRCEAVWSHVCPKYQVHGAPAILMAGCQHPLGKYAGYSHCIFSIDYWVIKTVCHFLALKSQ